nr:hypothetical protein [Lachnospiraceae bacterium]
AVYSDEWLPKVGELDRNLVNYDMDRVVCFDEKKAFDELIREGRFADHSNSFLVLAGLLESEAEKEYPIYAKYSDERNEKYRIVTVITNKGSKRGVYKKALSKASTDHIKALKDNYKKLSKMYGESLFTPDHCNTENEKENEAEFEYLSGITFKEYLNSLEEKKEYDSMLKLILKFKDLLLGIYKEDFKNTEENDKAFKEVFGDIYRGEDKTAPLSDIDLIFENIVFDKEGLPFGKWSVLDYEWTLDFKIPLKFIIYRSLFYYLRDKKESSFLDYLSEKNIDLYELMGIDEREKDEIFPGFEESFQLYIKRGTVSFSLIYEVMPTKALSLEKMVSDNLWRTNLKNPQIYASRERNRGFGPEDYIVAYGEYDELEKSITLKLELSEDIKEIRVDPTENECLLKVLNIELEEGERSDRASSKGRSIDSYLINGYPLSDSFFVFDHKDPQLVIRDLPDSKKILTISYIVSYPDTSVSEDIYSYFREEEERKDEEKRKKGIKGFFGVGRNEDLGPYSQYRYNR